MKRIIKKIFVCIYALCLMIPALVMANDAYDQSKAIERDSGKAAQEAEKGNYEDARKEAGKGFDEPTTPNYNSSDYDIPLPGKPKIDNE